VKFIYLQYNILSHVEKGTFSQLKKLEVLDLSENALRDVPAEIFHLPLLRSLYLERNVFSMESFNKIPNPIQAPLKKLNIANNNLNLIPPQFGILPDLNHLNISGNRMIDLTPQQFSPFCNLKEVDLNNTAMDKCRCVDVVDFLTGKRDVDISSFYCRVNSGGQFEFLFKKDLQEK
jgi:Leucine-rich repeat (LRR) protein